MKRREFVVCLAVVAVIFPWDLTQRQVAQCRSNVWTLSRAMEIYCSDNAGKYPRSLRCLVRGRYLAEIPTCPAAGRDTYSPSYASTANPDDYQLGCLGRNHPVATTCPEFLEVSHRGDYPWHDTRADYCHAFIDCEARQ